MRNEIKIDKDFYILSRNIDNAERCKVIETCDDCFKVRLKNKRKYETDEAVELFTMTARGQLFFESIVKETDGDLISVWYPISSRYLQRREFSRIPDNREIKLEYGKKSIEAKLSDISAGGLKLFTKEQLQLLKDYKVSLTIENEEICADFQPIRIETKEGGFVSSGKFSRINNYDRISLVQYCFRKQIENNTV